MNDRLTLFMRAESITAAKFAEILQVQPSSISHLLSGRNKPNFDFIARMLRMFPDLNPDWLINGEGQMYRGVVTNKQTNLHEKVKDNSKFTTDINELDFTTTNIDNEKVTNDTSVTTENIPDCDQKVNLVDSITNFNANLSNNPNPTNNVNKIAEPVTEPANGALNDNLIDKIVVFYADNTFSAYNKRH